MGSEQKRTSPYREGVRIEPTEAPNEPLPDFLTVRYDDLVEREKIEWEATFKPPKWWVKHVSRHVDVGPDDVMRRAIEPRTEPFRNSLVWTAIVIAFWIGIHTVISGDQRHDPVRTANMACGVLLGVGTLICSLNGFWWSIKHVGLPPMSLYLTFKEVVAWNLWSRVGKRWKAEDWDEQCSVERVANTFRNTTIAQHAKDLATLRVREGTCREEVSRARDRIDSGERLRDRLDTEDTINRGQLARSIAMERERADALGAKADRLGALARDGGRHLEALERAISTYVSVQKSRLWLRKGNSLAADETSDLVQQEAVRDEHLKLRAILRQVEAVFQGPPARTTATGEDELTAQIREASERTAARG